MAQNCHPNNPTGTFNVHSTVTNNSKGMLVHVDLPTDQNKYEVDEVITRVGGGHLSIDITLKASLNPASAMLDVQVEGYETIPQGSLTSSAHLFVYLEGSNGCEKKKKEDEDLTGKFEQK